MSLAYVINLERFLFLPLENEFSGMYGFFPEFFINSLSAHIVLRPLKEKPIHNNFHLLKDDLLIFYCLFTFFWPLSLDKIEGGGHKTFIENYTVVEHWRLSYEADFMYVNLKLCTLHAFIGFERIWAKLRARAPVRMLQYLFWPKWITSAQLPINRHTTCKICAKMTII